MINQWRSTYPTREPVQTNRATSGASVNRSMPRPSRVCCHVRSTTSNLSSPATATIRKAWRTSSTPGRRRYDNCSGAASIRPVRVSLPTICGQQDCRSDRRVRDLAPLSEYLASVAPNVICVSPNAHRPIASVSHNPSGKDSFIAVPGEHHCEPLHVAGRRSD